ncbi:SDR family oxidoreductase [Paralcaligenes sp. KSB-10]|uniref:SDR family NAD(P)-dependent oxidoreductase n=1 Tax=Paralcaligenes sp. KSB-10 TaxID=2901142 RepID=UPI001E439612|nr:SDR family NAD(P)-dependent oxidoreductase [Paralcaligenes sp. KSB-10]UHL63348.1 SDR family oxidoreductase [Paralcaligenes sp. KSB-10]
MNQYDFQNRVAIVTGGAQGIGLAITQALLKGGAEVAIWDINPAELAIAEKDLAHLGRVATMQVDVADPDSVKRAAAATKKTFGKFDIAVNSAGIAGVNATVAEYPEAEWNRVIDVNLNGTFYVGKAVLPEMIANNYGRIVNIASIAGKEGNPNAGAYSASKAGVIGLTKSMGKETASHDISVNAITPAAAKTRIFDQITQQHIDYMLSKIPRNRFVLTSEIASMVAWLVSEDNSFTTGAVFDLSGGRATY